MVKIGHNTTDELWNINYKRMHRFVDKIIPFVKVAMENRCADMGEANPKMEYLKKQLGLDVDQISGIDFNFDYFPTGYDVIFAFEVIEHLQNPLHFMSTLKLSLNNHGSIYVTIPCNPRWMWMDGHYNEIPKKHFEKWILKPLGLKIARYKRVNFVHDWRGLFIGFRPLMRVLRGETHWKSLIRTVLYYKYDIYEIKKAN